MASPIASTSSAAMASVSASTAPSRRRRVPTPPTPDEAITPPVTDRYYGQQAMASLCEHVINALFDISSAYPGLPPTPPLSPNGKEPPHLVEFIAYALYRTRLPDAVVHHSLYLLSRLKSRYPSARGTASSPHRLFLSSLMLSSKINMDDTYSNRSWTIVGGNFFALKEVNQMERELFAFLGWNVVVRREDLDSFVRQAETDLACARACRSSGIRAPRPSILSLAGDAPLTPPPERERPKRRRESSQGPSACSRTARAEAAAIALLRPGGHHEPQLIRSMVQRASSASAVVDSNESSAASSATSSNLPSPLSASPRTPASPESRSPHELDGAWSKKGVEGGLARSGPVIYRGPGFQAY